MAKKSDRGDGRPSRDGGGGGGGSGEGGGGERHGRKRKNPTAAPPADRSGDHDGDDDDRRRRRAARGDGDGDGDGASQPKGERDPREVDPDGTMNVARGRSVERTKVRGADGDNKGGVGDGDGDEPAAVPVPLEAVQLHLRGTGTSSAWSDRRLDALRRDDADPVVKDPRRQRALESRRRSKGNKAAAATLKNYESKRWNAAVAAASAQVLLSDQPGVLEAENDMERTSSVTQAQLVRHLRGADPAAASLHYTLKMPGPHGMEYDRSGRYAVLYGVQQGHLAVVDCRERSLECEFQVGDRVADATFLHNFTLFAAAQSHQTFIYDRTGAEVHRLADHTDPLALQFLPYHWLLASVGRAGWLKYQDTSTGQLVSSHRTRLGPCKVLRQNPSNAVLHAGHSNGTVTLWSPAQPSYLAKVLCHKGSPVQSLAVDLEGSTMVTGGSDRAVKLWDLRMVFKPLHSYSTYGIPVSLDVSQRGVLGIAHGRHATFWGEPALRRKERDPYMHHLQPGADLRTLRFRPYEDACGIGFGGGVASLVVPGSGEPNVDTSEYHTNPGQDAKQRREQEVRALLDKLSPAMIGLDPDQVGGVEESDPHRRLARVQDLAEQANASADASKPKKKKGKKRGKSKIQTQLRRRKSNVIDQQTLKLREEREREKALEAAASGAAGTAASVPGMKESAPDALSRFF